MACSQARLFAPKHGGFAIFHLRNGNALRSCWKSWGSQGGKCAPLRETTHKAKNPASSAVARWTRCLCADTRKAPAASLHSWTTD